MDLQLDLWTRITLGAGLVVAGFVIGLIASRFGGTPKARIRTLEKQLREERERGTEYREAVAKHFGDTADKFRDLTKQHTALYTQLAQGARDLCSDRLAELQHGFDLALPSATDRHSDDPSADHEDKR